MFVTGWVDNSVGGENAGFSNTITLTKKTLKMTLNNKENLLQQLAKLSKASAVCISIGSLDHVIGRVHCRK